MAQTFSYSFLSVRPLPEGIHKGTNMGQSEFVLSLVGAATSVSDGMTIASIATDLTYISEMWVSRCTLAAGKTYKLVFVPGTSNAAATAKIAIVRHSTGAALSAAVDLSGVAWQVTGRGTGPFASAIS